jgi:prephenate dehydratase
MKKDDNHGNGLIEELSLWDLLKYMKLIDYNLTKTSSYQAQTELVKKVFYLYDKCLNH